MTAHFILNPAENLSVYMDKNGHKATYTYDNLNRLTGVTDPEGESTFLEYDLREKLAACVETHKLYKADNSNCTRRV